MKITENLTCFFIVVVILFVPSCAQGEIYEEKSLVIGSWNVQNLFDGVDDGTEYEEYKALSGWQDSYYRNRLRNINKVLAYNGLNKSDILILNEVENEKTVVDILELSELKSRGFIYYAFAGEKGGAINTAVVSRIPVLGVRIHECEGLRPILEVQYEFNSQKFFILAVHAKSNIGNQNENAEKRLYLANQIKIIAENLKVDYPMCSIAIAGDFNEDISELNMMADMRYESNRFTDCPLRILSENSKQFWYSLWTDSSLNLDAEGSYFYNGAWKGYDNILVNGAKVLNAGVVFEGVLKNAKNQPNRWIRDLLTGVSDHLPIWVEIAY